MLNKEKYFIIGPRHNWEVTRFTLLSLGSILGIIFLFLVGVTIFQYFYYQYSFTIIKNNYSNQKSRTQDLQNIHNDLQKKISTLQIDIEKKASLINNLKNSRQIDKNTQKITEGEIERYQKNIKRFQTKIKNRTLQIQSLERQQNQHQQQIQSLNNQIIELEENINAKQLSNNKTSSSFESNPKQLVIEQFKLTSTNTNISIRFNLRNISLEAQSGHISIIPLSKDQLNENIEFNNQITSPFLIRRFRPYSKIFKIQDYPSISQIRIIVWNQNKTLLLTQNFLVN